MRVSRFPQLLAATGLALSWGDAALPQERTILVDSHRVSLLQIDEAVLSGRVAQRGFRIVAGKENETGATSVEAYLDGTNFGYVNLGQEQFPKIDLYTLVVEEGQHGALIVSLRYGDARRGCFDNDDGRDIVEVYFHESEPPEIFPSSLGEVCVRG